MFNGIIYSQGVVKSIKKSPRYVSRSLVIEIASNIVEKLGKKVVVGIHLKKNCKLPSGESIPNIIEKFKCNSWIGLVFACVSPENAYGS